MEFGNPRALEVADEVDDLALHFDSRLEHAAAPLDDEADQPAQVGERRVDVVGGQRHIPRRSDDFDERVRRDSLQHERRKCQFPSRRVRVGVTDVASDQLSLDPTGTQLRPELGVELVALKIALPDLGRNAEAQGTSRYSPV